MHKCSQLKYFTTIDFLTSSYKTENKIPTNAKTYGQQRLHTDRIIVRNAGKICESHSTSVSLVIVVVKFPGN